MKVGAGRAKYEVTDFPRLMIGSFFLSIFYQPSPFCSWFVLSFLFTTCPFLLICSLRTTVSCGKWRSGVEVLNTFSLESWILWRRQEKRFFFLIMSCLVCLYCLSCVNSYPHLNPIRGLRAFFFGHNFNNSPWLSSLSCLGFVMVLSWFCLGVGVVLFLFL